MTHYNRMSLLITLVLLGIIIASLVNLPGWSISIIALGSPLSIRITTYTVVTFLLIVASCAGTDAVIRTHPKALNAKLSYTLTFWIAPTLTTVAAISLVPPLFPNRWWWVGGLSLTYLGLAAVLLAEYHAIDPEGPYYAQARLGLSFFTYAAALILFTLIYAPRIRSLLSATAVMLVTVPLALELLRDGAEGSGRTWLYAGLSGLMLGEVTWGLNYWDVHALAGGLSLLLVFHLITGLAQQHLRGRLSRWVVTEYAVTVTVGLVLVFGIGSWFR